MGRSDHTLQVVKEPYFDPVPVHPEARLYILSGIC